MCIELEPGKCPYRYDDDDGTIQQCIERGHCGCDEKDKQSSASPACSVADSRKEFEAKWKKQR